MLGYFWGGLGEGRPLSAAFRAADARVRPRRGGEAAMAGQHPFSLRKACLLAACPGAMIVGIGGSSLAASQLMFIASLALVVAGILTMILVF